MVDRRIIILFVVLALTGCAAATGSEIAVPTTGSQGAASTGPPRIGAPDAVEKPSWGAVGAVGAGSFPRSFLIPGTDTSIRLGG